MDDEWKFDPMKFKSTRRLWCELLQINQESFLKEHLPEFKIRASVGNPAVIEAIQMVDEYLYRPIPANRDRATDCIEATLRALRN